MREEEEKMPLCWKLKPSFYQINYYIDFAVLWLVKKCAESLTSVNTTSVWNEVWKLAKIGSFDFLNPWSTNLYNKNSSKRMILLLVLSQKPYY